MIVKTDKPLTKFKSSLQNQPNRIYGYVQGELLLAVVLVSQIFTLAFVIHAIRLSELDLDAKLEQIYYEKWLSAVGLGAADLNETAVGFPSRARAAAFALHNSSVALTRRCEKIKQRVEHAYICY